MDRIKEVIKSCTGNYSVENLIEIYNCFKENNDKEKQKKYKDDFKELIQLIIDFLIFGDKKKDQTIFENFCELDFMKEFIIASKSKNMDILLQIIQSMSALILTITNKATLFYIFSNNFINNIITNDDIQESGEDFLSFYVNFLKSLSLKIDSTTIQLFFQKEKNSFPLLENALKIYNHEDSMIKNVVRNIFLKFAGLSKEYVPLKDYLMSLPILKYFCFLSCRLTDMTIEINRLAGYNMLYKYNSQTLNFNYDDLKALHDDLIDEILYLNDILSINDSQISFALLNSLLYYYICPLLLGSIFHYKFCFYDNQYKKGNISIKYIISPEVALYILTLFFSNIHSDSLLNILCSLLFKPKINKDIITKFVNVQFNNSCPIYLSNYFFKYKEQSFKEKNLTFVEYITYNFNKKFICSLIMKPNYKYNEIMQLYKKYEKAFDNSSFEPYNNYENIFNDIDSKLTKNDKIFMRNYHNIISIATGVKSGLSDKEYENNFLFILNKENDMIDNPFKKIILDELLKCGFEIVNMGVNLLLYSMFYYIILDKNKNMNKSVSRKMLYYECNLLPFDLYLNKNIVNRNIDDNDEDGENEENEENLINNDENKKIIIQKENNDNNIDNIDNIDNKDNIDNINNKNNINSINNINNTNNENKISNENNVMLLKTENYELKYNEKNDIYSNDFIYDNKTINNLIDLLKFSRPYCPLELLLNIYNIRYLLCPIKINEKNDSISKDLYFTDEHKIKLLNTLIFFIEKIKIFLKTNISIKYISFECFENVWKIYHEDYSFNIKNLIIKYILTPYYICIPSATINVEDFPFQNNNNKYIFDTYLMGYLALHDLVYNKITENFPLETGNFEFNSGDKINKENFNIPSSKFKLIKILIKTRNRNEFEECTLFIHKNTIIIGNEEKEEETGINKIIIKFIHPIRELEICLDNSYPNALLLYFKKNNYIIECESKDARKEIKAELEQKRNEFRKWELNNISKLFDDEEKKYRELVNNNNYKKENIFKME